MLEALIDISIAGESSSIVVDLVLKILSTRRVERNNGGELSPTPIDRDHRVVVYRLPLIRWRPNTPRSASSSRRSKSRASCDFALFLFFLFCFFIVIVGVTESLTCSRATWTIRKAAGISRVSVETRRRKACNLVVWRQLQQAQRGGGVCRQSARRAGRLQGQARRTRVCCCSRVAFVG